MIVLVNYTYAQDNHCNCSDNLKKLIAKTEENYAGYKSKVNATTQASYRQLVKSISLKAKNERNPKSCFYLLKSYIRFFKDKHFLLRYLNENDYDYEIINIIEQDFKNKLENDKTSALEGIWINADSSLKLGIQKQKNKTYKAIVLESRDAKIPKGLVYMTFKTSRFDYTVKSYDYFISTDVPAKLKGNLLQIWNQNMFGKIYPTHLTKKELEELETWRYDNNGLNFKKLSPQTAYLKIPTFLNNDEKIQALVNASDSIIRNTDNLIVDLTGNGGGNTGWISFLPYFMTNPIVQYDSYLRVTPENVKFKLNDLEPFVLNPIPPEYQKYFPEEVLSKYKKTYKELTNTQNEYLPIPGVIFPLEKIFKQPKKIALMVDNLSGSSAEYFFFISKQSKKTTTYGVNTIGMMDYEGMSNPTPLPYNKYYLTIPIVKSSWTDKHPIDQIGFKPDVNLQSINYADWVEHIRKKIEKQ